MMDHHQLFHPDLEKFHATDECIGIALVLAAQYVQAKSLRQHRFHLLGFSCLREQEVLE
jgi:hypothetical protein